MCLPLLIIPFCALLVVAPLLWHGNSCGNDFNFHLLSWMEVHAAWHAGTLYPHWAMQPNSGAGEPRFIFYPPFSWMLGAALASLFGGTVWGWSVTAGAFVFIILTLAGFAALALLRRITTERAALFAACFYLANPYMLFVIYERSAFAELMAAIWMPLLFLFALKKKIHILPLALVITALWLTHDGSAVMGCYALALLVLVAAIRERSWHRSLQHIIRAAASAALGLGLAAFYIVPAAWEKQWVQIWLALGEGIQFSANFLFTHTADALHNSILFMVSWIAVSLLTLAAVLCIVISFAVRSQRKPPIRSLPLLPVILLTAVIGFLLLPVSLPVWRHVPELIYLQFPWRLLLLLSVAVAVLLGSALGHIPARARSFCIAAPLFVAASVITCYPFFHQFCDFEDVVPAQVAAFHSGKGYQGLEGTAEYTPLATLPEELPDVMQPVTLVLLRNAHDPSDTPPPVPAGASLHVNKWRADHRQITIVVPAAVAEKNPQAAVLRILDYPTWRVRVNGQLQQPRLHTRDGRLYVPLSGGRSVITIDHVVTLDVWLGRGVSIFSLLIVIALFAFGKFRHPSSPRSPSV